jgi:hypothetical protein
MRLTPLHLASKLVFCCAITACLIGCGPGRPAVFPVTGSVTIDGSPVSEGIITFENAGAGIAESAEIGADGTYSTELLEGTYSVTLMPAFVEQKSEDGTMEEVFKNPENFPEKYHNTSSSGLTINVSGETKYDAAMTKK